MYCITFPKTFLTNVDGLISCTSVGYLMFEVFALLNRFLPVISTCPFHLRYTKVIINLITLLIHKSSIFQTVKMHVKTAKNRRFEINFKISHQNNEHEKGLFTAYPSVIVIQSI